MGVDQITAESEMETTPPQAAHVLEASFDPLDSDSYPLSAAIADRT
jgi:hypothetical protein